MDSIRSFIAVELPEELKLELTQLQEQLSVGNNVLIKWVDPKNIHLTLKFLGNINTEITGKITLALEEAIRGINPFLLKVKGLGVFPNLRRVQVVWVGLTGDLDRLSQLQQRVDKSLVHLGFIPESRPFAPHLTIARLRDRTTPEERQNLGRLITRTNYESSHMINVDSVHLMRSQLTNQGPIYNQISSIALK
jgi:2'-5' RNA ligase